MTSIVVIAVMTYLQNDRPITKMIFIVGEASRTLYFRDSTKEKVYNNGHEQKDLSPITSDSVQTTESQEDRYSCAVKLRSVLGLYPKLFELHYGGKGTNPDELTKVGDAGKRARPTERQLEVSRV